jgi:hypothetical protein
MSDEPDVSPPALAAMKVIEAGKRLKLSQHEIVTITGDEGLILARAAKKRGYVFERDKDGTVIGWVPSR